MATNFEKQIRQQQILKELGYDPGKIDGVWSLKSIEAKQKWERQRNFSPAVPNNGLPFKKNDVLPKGIIYNPQTDLLEIAGKKLPDPVTLSSANMQESNQSSEKTNVVSLVRTKKVENKETKSVFDTQQNNVSTTQTDNSKEKKE